LTIHWLEAVDSTQRFALDGLGSGELRPPVAVVADRQHAGRGSRGNAWTGLTGNLFLTFAVERANLPDDLKLESCSIYFAFLLKQTLETFGSKVWLKWPNDFYVGDRKIGGVITTFRQETLVCGIGLNLAAAPEDFGLLDIEIERKALIDAYIEHLESFPEWKQIFRLYALEFDKSRSFSIHNKNEKLSLQEAVLQNDGSVLCNAKRIYSLR